MTDSTIRVYVDSLPVDVPPTATVVDAVSALNRDLGAAVVAGERNVTDSRGLPIAPDSPLHGGAILRVIPSRPRAT